MTDKLWQEAAFPMAGFSINGKDIAAEFGLTKREWFAGMAMMGIMANSQTIVQIARAVDANPERGENIIKVMAYRQADVMLKEAEK